MTNQTTLIIFGRQLKDVPKKPMLPSGYRMEQLLAIGLIYSTSDNPSQIGSEKMSIMFHWFLSPTIHDMIDWIIAINNSIPNNKQLISNDELTMSLVMAEATYFNQYMMLQDQMRPQGTFDASGAYASGKIIMIHEISKHFLELLSVSSMRLRSRGASFRFNSSCQVLVLRDVKEASLQGFLTKQQCSCSSKNLFSFSSNSDRSLSLFCLLFCISLRLHLLYVIAFPHSSQFSKNQD